MEPESNNKARMRPAEDVLKRLKWDRSLDPEDFIVGYEDRFLGLCETPYTEYNLVSKVVMS